MARARSSASEGSVSTNSPADELEVDPRETAEVRRRLFDPGIDVAVAIEVASVKTLQGGGKLLLHHGGEGCSVALEGTSVSMRRVLRKFRAR
jgi:hypothetical protein